ncbi:carbohydrate ABC transporter permease [Camelliibacillus cellulosilyticus]|uniref:Carbohydrate ABC transporter permease n=1 Tax=Camelliibacillus cellulosilyticus TaxID=2174486 RepID=A0ABV9GMD5_9BACL
MILAASLPFLIRAGQKYDDKGEGMKGDKLFITLFLLPAGIITSVFLYYPFFKGIALSFYHTQGFYSKTFGGLSNYQRLIDDPVVWKATLNSLELMVLAVVFQVGIAMVLAVMIDLIKHGRGFYRTTFFFPVVISGTAIGLLFSLIYLYKGGMLNTILAHFGLPPVLWLSQKTALIGVAIPTIWQYVGFYFVILLTAIMKIPDSFYEAGEIEGMNAFQRTVRITIPLIFSDLKVCLILAITGAFRVYDIVKVITNGGPLNASQVLGTYMYEQTFTAQSVGYGSTIAVLIVILGVALSMVTNRLLRKEEITY